MTNEPVTEWEWRWVGWASWPLTAPVLWLSAATIAIDVASSWLGWPSWYVGRVAMSPALPLAVALAILIGGRNIGFAARDLRAWREFLAVGVVGIAVVLIAYPASVADVQDRLGVVIALMGEAMVYRFAVVILLGAACARVIGREWRNTTTWGFGPVVASLLGAGVVFSLLPGHVAQMKGVMSIVPFASLVMLLGYVGLRSGSLLPSFLAHVAIDLTALAFLASSVSGTVRLGVDLSVLVILVAALMVAGRRLGLRRRVPTVIDLRDDVRPVPSAEAQQFVEAPAPVELQDPWRAHIR